MIHIIALLLVAAPIGGLDVSRRASSAATPATTHLAWSELALQERTLFDVQANAKVTVRGISLDALVKRGPKRVNEDTALLHFANGMAVPVPLDAAGAPLIDVFIARERRREDGVFVRSFAPVIHERSPWMEQRAIVFGDNKVVVSQGKHPAQATTTTAFTPWAHVDSLKEVELVLASSVHAALDVSPDVNVRRGLQVFEQRCQYCHGVRGKGASFGWDFVEPIAMSTWRDADSLFYHVKMRKLDGAERGLMMPPQPDATLDEMKALWAWMAAIGDPASEWTSPR